MIDHRAITAALDRHQCVGFQFSGGRDSTAVIYLLRPYWERVTVYHLDAGDQFPETIEVVRQVELELPRPIVHIAGYINEVRRDYGMASDLIPVDNSAVGRMMSGRALKIIGRHECCARSLMVPMHARMRSDGVTLLIRGQRDDEYVVQPKRDGDVEDGIEFLYPIQDWTGDQVQAYLVDNHLPVAPFYAHGMQHAPECMGCTAWWDEGRARYLKQYHPVHFKAYQANMQLLRSEIDAQYKHMEYES